MNRREQAFSDELLRLAQQRGLEPANVVRVIAEIYTSVARALPQPQRREFVTNCCALLLDACDADENHPTSH